MFNKLKLTLLTLLVAACPALAQFEGVLEMKMTITDKEGANLGGGTMKVAVAKAGVRSELDLKRGPMGIKMVGLQKTARPDTIYHLNETAHTYSEIDLAKARALGNQEPQPKPEYTVEKLGEEEILGYKTQHVLLKPKDPTSEAGSTTELWTAKGFLDYETFSSMLNGIQSHHGRAATQEARVNALKDAGAEGMPLKTVSTAPDGSKTTTEVVKAEKKSLPASTFEIPAGYTKSEGGMLDMMMNSMTGPQAEEQRKRMQEAQKRMQEALKNMSPEQRQKIEELMKQRGMPHP